VEVLFFFLLPKHVVFLNSCRSASNSWRTGRGGVAEQQRQRRGAMKMRARWRERIACHR